MNSRGKVWSEGKNMHFPKNDSRKLWGQSCKSTWFLGQVTEYTTFMGRRIGNLMVHTIKINRTRHTAIITWLSKSRNINTTYIANIWMITERSWKVWKKLCNKKRKFAETLLQEWVQRGKSENNNFWIYHANQTSKDILKDKRGCGDRRNRLILVPRKYENFVRGMEQAPEKWKLLQNISEIYRKTKIADR